MTNKHYRAMLEKTPVFIFEDLGKELNIYTGIINAAYLEYNSMTEKVETQFYIKYELTTSEVEHLGQMVDAYQVVLPEDFEEEYQERLKFLKINRED